MIARRTSVDTAAAFLARYERRIGTAPGQDGAPGEPDAAALPASQPTISVPAAPQPVPTATAGQPAELALDAKLCGRCRIRPAIAGRPGPARCTECTNTPPGATETCGRCSRCGRKLPWTPTAHHVDGQRVCRRCDPPPRGQPGRRRNRFYRNDTPRARTISRAALRREVRMHEAVEPPPGPLPERPRTRGECRDDARPCPWVGCRHHLYLDINPESGSIKINFPDLEPWELKRTCALDIADHGGLTLEEVGVITNLTRERIRQVEVHGLLKIKMASPSADELGADLLAVASMARGVRR